jgi:branched-chain amino acid transport system permease protein
MVRTIDDARVAEPRPTRSPERDWWSSVATAAVLIVALPLATAHAMPKLLQQHDYLNLDTGVAFAVAALSINLLFGYAGQLSLGHAGLLGAGAFAGGFVTSHWHASMTFGFPFAVVVGALVALVIGVPALRLRGLYLAIVTVIFGLVMQYSILPSNALSGASAGVDTPRRIWGDRYNTDTATYLVICGLLLLVVWVVDSHLTRSRVGRAMRTIRENEDVAAAYGIGVVRYKLVAFVLSGGMAGLAGAMWGYSIDHVNSETFQFTTSLQIVTLVIIAGAGRKLPVTIVALVGSELPLFLTSLHYYAYIVEGLGLVATMSMHPEGVADLLVARRRPRATVDEEDESPALPQLPMPARPLSGPPPGEPLLEVSDVVVRFGGLHAVDTASLVVPAGTVTGLIGPNGAGKSTLFNAISGLVRIDHGSIRYRGQEIRGLRPDQRASLGIARSFQQIGLAKDLSVRENFLLAQHRLAPYGDVAALLRLPHAARAEHEFADRADTAIAALGFERLATMPLKHLSGGQQRIVEIACLLMAAPDLVLLDEPSAGMSPAAAENLAERLRDLRDALGRTVLLIEHNVPLVLDTCDYVYVLDAGRMIAEGAPAEVAADPRVIEAYYGAAVPA